MPWVLQEVLWKTNQSGVCVFPLPALDQWGGLRARAQLNRRRFPWESEHRSIPSATPSHRNTDDKRNVCIFKDLTKDKTWLHLKFSPLHSSPGGGQVDSGENFYFEALIYFHNWGKNTTKKKKWIKGKNTRYFGARNITNSYFLKKGILDVSEWFKDYRCNTMCLLFFFCKNMQTFILFSISWCQFFVYLQQ